MSRKKVEQGAGMVAAEKYARFFLENPLVAHVYIFGSTALRGDGNDVDMVLEVSDAQVGFQFLSGIKALAAEFFKDKKPGEIPVDQYENLKDDRIALALDLLGLQKMESGGSYYKDIAWGGKFQEWDSLCVARRWLNALIVEAAFYRPADLFLMPAGWKTDTRVRELLPNPATDRPWKNKRFLDTMILQSRLYDATTGTFNPRVKGTRREEAALRAAMEKEAKGKRKKRTSLTDTLHQVNNVNL